MVSVRKDHASPPALVDESWRRIEAWLGEHLPGVKATLRPGVSDADLAKFEETLGRPLPDDVRESWKIHDGQKEGRGNPPGLIYGKSLLALVSRDTMAGRSALEEWQNLARRVDLGASAEDPGETSFPPGAIRRCFGCRGWVPLHWDGNRNYLGIDLDPGPNGVVGQVINFGGDEHRKFVLATSWGRFLEDFADELEAGNFVIDKKNKYGSFLLKKPKKQPLYTQYEAWAKAKLAPAFRDRD